MRGLKVLITNYRFATRSGTEIYVRDLALELLKRGHSPIIYSPRLGEIADEVRFATVPVVDDLKKIAATPDIIHGQHLDETMTALLHFPNVPAIYVCHEWHSILDQPPRIPRILRYVAVDEACYDKLVFECAVPEERVRLLLNAVDLERFKPRSPLPVRPQSALLYNNLAEEGVYLEAIREACARCDLKLDVLGQGLNAVSIEPEKALAQYDIVFAKGRSALESLAVGAAVVIHFGRGVGHMVCNDELEKLLPLNFGIRAMSKASSPQAFTEALCREIARYDALDAGNVTRRVRQMCGYDSAINEMISLYEEAIAERGEAKVINANLEYQAVAEYVRWSSLRNQNQLDSLNNSAAMRLKRRIVDIPFVGKAAHSLARRLSGSNS